MNAIRLGFKALRTGSIFSDVSRNVLCPISCDLQSWKTSSTQPLLPAQTNVDSSLNGPLPSAGQYAAVNTHTRY